MFGWTSVTAKNWPGYFVNIGTPIAILHLAAQVAVTTSVTEPREDFEINALGTFNVLEAVRKAGITAPILYSSTNKVYGEMTDVGVAEQNGRYGYRTLPSGVSEERSLDFHSPYGCSKGSADQYFIDYHRIYGLRTIVFRQSCIYGYRQFGAEDQGWVAWFMIASQLGRPITVFGDGKQVRDVLFIDDLLDAYDAAFAAGDRAVGKAYNIGGGPDNVLSLLELLAYIEKRQNGKLGYGLAAGGRAIKKFSSAIFARPRPNWVGHRKQTACVDSDSLRLGFGQSGIVLTGPRGCMIHSAGRIRDERFRAGHAGFPRLRGLKVLHVGKFYPPHMGGMETHLEALCGELRPSVDFASSFPARMIAPVEETMDGVQVSRVPTRFTVASTPILSGDGAGNPPDRAGIVHIHLPNPTAVLAYLASGHRGAWLSPITAILSGRRCWVLCLRPSCTKHCGAADAIIATSPDYRGLPLFWPATWTAVT